MKDHPLPHTHHLRALRCPVAPGFHADHARAGAETLRWAERFGLIDTPAAARRLRHADVARLGAAVYHDGYSSEALQLATDFMTWLYLHDDLWVDGVRRDPIALDRDHSHLLAVLRGARASSADHPLVHALLDVCDRLAAWRTDLAPFLDAVEQYLTAKFWESHNHLNRILPDVRLYVQMRSCGGGVVACFELGAIVRPIRLSGHLRNHAHVQTMAHLANHLVCWANDIASLAKEIEEDTTTNLVMALRHEHHLTWPAALERATAMWNDAMGGFLRVAEQLGELPLSEAERECLEKYLVLLSSWVRGNLDYAQVVRRFDVPLPEEPPAPRLQPPAR